MRSTVANTKRSNSCPERFEKLIGCVVFVNEIGIRIDFFCMAGVEIITTFSERSILRQICRLHAHCPRTYELSYMFQIIMDYS